MKRVPFASGGAGRCSLLLALVLLAAGQAAAQERPEETFAAIQERVDALRDRLQASTVGIRGGGSGSGVIISEDGYILTAAHVVNRPERAVTIRMPDGRDFPGRTLGVYQRADIALLKFDEPPEGLPVAQMGDSNTLRRGQWVIATGHPGGYRRDRPPPVRLGRVLNLPPQEPGVPHRGRVSTDTPLIGGDSGGPLWDLNGRLVAIHTAVSGPGNRPTGRSLHIAVAAARPIMEMMKEPLAITDPPAPVTFREPFTRGQEALEAGDAEEATHLLRSAAAIDPLDATTRFLLAQAHARAGRPEAALEQLEEAVALGYNDLAALREAEPLLPLHEEARFQALVRQLEPFARLEGIRRSEDPVHAAAARAARLGPTAGTVRLFAGDQELVWGTLVSADGDVLTKASELPEEGELVCLLPDGRRLPAQRVSVDERWDVALLHASGVSAEPVRFGAPPPVGAWLLSPDEKGEVAALGVLGVASLNSAARRTPPVPPGGDLGAQIQAANAGQLRAAELEAGARLTVSRNSAAQRAGLVTGDVLYELDGRPIRRPQDAAAYLREKQPGDEVVLKIAREDQRLERTITLVRPSPQVSRAERMSTEVSVMQGPFRGVIQHDLILRPREVGGPVFDLEGRCIGINIARASRIATYAIPAEVVQEIYQQLREGGGR